MKPALKILVLGSIFLTACATSRAKNSGEPKEGASSVHIAYVLGHENYHLLVREDEGAVTGEARHHKQLVGSGPVDHERYHSFLDNVSQFVTSGRLVAQAETPCRTPFTVTVQIGTETKSSTGCRTSEEHEISRLIKEGEWLLYSKK